MFSEKNNKLIFICIFYSFCYNIAALGVVIWKLLKRILKTIVFGKPIKFDPNIEMDEQRKIINDYL